MGSLASGGQVSCRCDKFSERVSVCRRDAGTVVDVLDTVVHDVAVVAETSVVVADIPVAVAAASIMLVCIC